MATLAVEAFVWAAVVVVVGVAVAATAAGVAAVVVVVVVVAVVVVVVVVVVVAAPETPHTRDREVKRSRGPRYRSHVANPDLVCSQVRPWCEDLGRHQQNSN